MGKKIKIFVEQDYRRLEEKVNEFLQWVIYVDVKELQPIERPEGRWYQIMVVYTNM